MHIRINLTDEPYFGIVLRGLRHWRDMQGWRSPLAGNAPTPTVLLEMTASIVAACVGTNAIPADGLVPLIEAVHKTILQLADAEPDAPALKPPVAIRKSVPAGQTVCLGDDKKLKMLKRHLRTRHDMTPEEYRSR